jgi:ubiquinone/menaquinone biosynthesis C-methylase UbiE
MEAEISSKGKFLDPKAIIRQLDVQIGGVVADFGCGSGYFSVPFAEAVGSEGMVYSLDILPSALESVSSKAKVAGLSNIIAKRANLENEKGSKLEDGILDWVILKDMLFQNANKAIIISEAYRVLKNGGEILVIEWNDKEQEIGPEMKLRLAEDELVSLVEKNGFHDVKKIDAGEFHYAFSARK